MQLKLHRKDYLRSLFANEGVSLTFLLRVWAGGGVIKDHNHYSTMKRRQQRGAMNDLKSPRCQNAINVITPLLYASSRVVCISEIVQLQDLCKYISLWATVWWNVTCMYWLNFSISVTHFTTRKGVAVGESLERKQEGQPSLVSCHRQRAFIPSSSLLLLVQK